MKSNDLRNEKNPINNKDEIYERVKALYQNKEYLEAYSQHTDLRVNADAQLAVGGLWEEIGLLQFQYLVEKGLQSHHKMLDIGCGTLRGGRHFIKYLSSSKYYGLDISLNAIEYGKKLLVEENLSHKNPHLVFNKNRDFNFCFASDKKFDFIIAQSVFTHLKPFHITECFKHVGQIMNDNSAFYFTYNKCIEYRQDGFKDFYYPLSFFTSLAKTYGFELKECETEYPHPRGQIMVELKKW